MGKLPDLHPLCVGIRVVFQPAVDNVRAIHILFLCDVEEGLFH